MSKLTDVETELRKIAEYTKTPAPHASKVCELAAEIVHNACRFAEENARMRDALEKIAHCDDLVIRGEDDGPEIWRRLRFCVNTAENILSNANVDLPDTAAQDSASQSSSPAVSG